MGDDRTGEAARILQLERRFTGTVLALFAHEANNRLATAQETVGLLEDVLAAAKAGGAEAVRECRSVASGLGAQLARLGTLNGHLAELADRQKDFAGPTKLTPVVDALLALTERNARQRQVNVTRELAAELPPVSVGGAVLQLLVYQLVAGGIERLPAQGRLRIATVKGRGRVGLRVLAEGAVPVGAEEAEAVQMLARAAGADVETGPTGPETLVWLPVGA